MYTHGITKSNKSIKNSRRLITHLNPSSFSIGILIIGIVFLTVSCAQSIVVLPILSQPSAVRDLEKDATKTDNSSIYVQWTPPSHMGTKEDGTVLKSDELSYRIYYLEYSEESPGQTIPTAESIQKNPKSNFIERKGINQARIIDLKPDQLYLVAVASYNSFLDLETIAIEIVDVKTSVAAAKTFNEPVSYAETDLQLYTNITYSIPTTSQPFITDSQVIYSLEKIDGLEIDSLLSINSEGSITIEATTRTGTARYYIRAMAANYNTQYVEITITIITSKSSAPGAVTGQRIVAGNTVSTSFSVEWTAPSNTGTKSDGTALNPEDLRFRVYYIEATFIEGITDQSVPSVRSIIQNPHSATSEDLENISRAFIFNLSSNTRYFVTVVSYNSFADLEGLSDEVLEVRTSEPGLNLSEFLEYDNTNFNFVIGFPTNIIRPRTLANTGSGTSEPVSYELVRKSGIEFSIRSGSDPLIIDSYNGRITIKQILNTGTAEYYVHAYAIGYKKQTIIINITVNPRPSEAASVSVDTTDYTSVGVMWVAPLDLGTKQDGTEVSPEELDYRVYYLAESLDQQEPTAESIQQDSTSTFVDVPGDLTSTQLVELEPDTGYYIVVALRIPTWETEVLSELLFAETKVLQEFEGDFHYLLEYIILANIMREISPSRTTLMVQDADIDSVAIVYSLEKIDGGLSFIPEPTINMNNGHISINSITNTGTADYIIRGSAEGYKTREKTIKLTIEASPTVRVVSYHSEVAIPPPIEIGQAIVDEESSPFALESTDRVFYISGLMVDEEYTIHFGIDMDSYVANNTLKKTTDNIGNLILSKLDVATIALIDGAVIGISGPGIVDTEQGLLHVATFHPSNIYSTYDLQAMRIRLDGDYVLQKNIEFTIPNDATASNFEAVGNDTNPFTGTLNGESMGLVHSITGLKIYTSTENYQGLFGVITEENPDSAVVQNLVLKGFNISGNTHVGSVAGWMKRGRVENVDLVVISDIAGRDLGKVEALGMRNVYSGGIVGLAGTDPTNTDIQLRIQNVSSDLEVIGLGMNSNAVGGLIGAMRKNATLTESYTSGTVRGNFKVGGLVGQLGSLPEDTNASVSGYATGTVEGKDKVGGLVGENSVGTVIGYMTGSVTGNNDVGGIVGINYNSATGYVTADITGNNNVGGLVGLNGEIGTTPSIVTGFTTGDVRGNSNVGALVGDLRSGQVSGYARSIVRRKSGSDINFGKTIGKVVQTGNLGSTYNSAIESKIYDSETGETDILNTTGEDGTERLLGLTTDQGQFDALTFGINPGQWKWIDEGKWPAINISDIKNVNEQPIDICKSTATEEQCQIDYEQYLLVDTYYGEGTNLHRIPVEFGQAIIDEGIIADDTVILSISNNYLTTDGLYTIHFGFQVGVYDDDVMFEKQSSGGSVNLLRSDLNQNSFTFEEGTVIGLMGPGIEDILHIATYQPSSIIAYQDLQAMSLNLEGDYELKNDIVFPDQSAYNYVAVGTIDDPFTGSLNGGNFSITGLQIDTMNDFQGLFGVIDAKYSTTVVAQNLTLNNFKILGNSYVGSLAGWIKQGIVQHVHVRVSSPDAGRIHVKGSNRDTHSSSTRQNISYYGDGGGLLGRAGTDESGKVVLVQYTSSTVNVDVNVDEDDINSNAIGGLVGRVSNAASVRASYASGNVLGINLVGGLVGDASGTVSGYARGNVTGMANYVGGLVGYNYRTTVSGYASGIVVGNEYVGGLVGNNLGTTTGYTTMGSVAGKAKVGGLVGWNEDTELSSSYTIGYVRIDLRRSSGTESTFGWTTGRPTTSTNVATTLTYYSRDETSFYEGLTGTDLIHVRDGYSGTEVSVSSSTSKSSFEQFSFGTAVGEWTWVADGMWPAINIGIFHLGNEQPIGP